MERKQIFNNGDKVRWREEYAQNAQEREQVFYCVEPASDGKCYIKPVDWVYGRDGIICPSFGTFQAYLELAE